MSVITKLNKDELESFLSDFNLGSLHGYKEIPEGTVNTNYFLEISSKNEIKPYVLSLFEHLNLETAEQYLQLTQFLHNKNLPCAMPSINITNQLAQLLKNKPSAIVTFLPGQSINTPNIQQCYALGEFLAQMHQCTQAYMPQIKNPMGNVWRSQHTHKLMPSFSLPEQTLAQQGLYIQTQIPWRDLPKAMIHYDLFRDNALFSQNELTGVFDFYYACFDAMLLDIAICINDWCTDWNSPERKLNNELTQALLSGYQSIRQFNNIEQQQLLPIIQLMAFHFWITRSINIKHPPKGSCVTTKSPEEFKIILENRLQMKTIQT